MKPDHPEHPDPADAAARQFVNTAGNPAKRLVLRSDPRWVAPVKGPAHVVIDPPLTVDRKTGGFRRIPAFGLADEGPCLGIDQRCIVRAGRFGHDGLQGPLAPNLSRRFPQGSLLCDIRGAKGPQAAVQAAVGCTCGL